MILRMTEQLTKSEAKMYFLEMGCSHFHMTRENPDYYSRYRASGIDKTIESTWISEEVERQFIEFPYDEPSKIAHAYSVLDALIDYNEVYLERMLDLTKQILEKVAPDQSSLVLGVITGRVETATHGDSLRNHVIKAIQKYATRSLAAQRILFRMLIKTKNKCCG